VVRESVAATSPCRSWLSPRSLFLLAFPAAFHSSLATLTIRRSGVLLWTASSFHETVTRSSKSCFLVSVVNFELTRLRNLTIVRVGLYKITYSSNSPAVSMIMSHFDSPFYSSVQHQHASGLGESHVLRQKLCRSRVNGRCAPRAALVRTLDALNV